MKSVGEAMAIGRSFPEALQKALRSLEKRGSSFSWKDEPGDKEELLRACRKPHDGRLVTVMRALRAGASVSELSEATGIDPWFLDQFTDIDEAARELRAAPELTAQTLVRAKRMGFSDVQIGELRCFFEAWLFDFRFSLVVFS